jgi:hypothetical protein
MDLVEEETRMKRLLPTLLLVLVCAVGFWYASSHNFFKEKKEPEVKVVNVKKGDATGIVIQDGDSVIELQRKDNAWTMAKPQALPLDTYSADSWVDSLGGAVQGKVVEAGASDLSKYGLAKPGKQFKVTLKDGSERALLIGDKMLIPSFYYAKVSGSNDVFQFDEEKVKSLTKVPLDFMEKGPIRMVFEKVSSASLELIGSKWTLSKNEPAKASYESAWKISVKDVQDKELKGNEASPVLDKILFLSTDRLVKPVSELDMTSPELKLELKETDAGKETQSFYTGKLDKEEDITWIVKQGDVWAYAIKSESIVELFQKGLELADSSDSQPQPQPQAPSPSP